MASANAGLELPATSLIAPFLAAIVASRDPHLRSGRGRDRIRINQKPAPKVRRPGHPAYARGPDNKDPASLAIRADLLSRHFPRVTRGQDAYRPAAASASRAALESPRTGRRSGVGTATESSAAAFSLAKTPSAPGRKAARPATPDALG